MATEWFCVLLVVVLHNLCTCYTGIKLYAHAVESLWNWGDLNKVWRSVPAPVQILIIILWLGIISLGEIG